MTHLTNIVIRQQNTRIRDAIFAVFIVLAAIVSVTAVSTVAQAASTHVTS